MSDSIQVAIKVRPLIKREKEENLPIQWAVQDNTIFTVDPETKKRGEAGFVFDHIFDMKKTNNDVFDISVKPIVDAAVNGFNGTIFAYGQTSSGKTYTMMGTCDEPGVIPLAVEHMFDAIANTNGREFLLRVSYLEIYNEKVNDLLNKEGVDLKVHEDVNGQVLVKCKEEVTNCPQNVLSIMKKGDKNRRIGETNMNERSSRSHTIFRITIESREAIADSDGAVQVSQLNLVDLAGSERARQTKATGERFKEGIQINMSLSALGLVIMQLSESQDGKYINFRDSKLTRLLQASLGGNAMTTIICNVTPAAVEETNCTLLFASRAKSVKNKPQLNEVMSDGVLLKRYAKQLSKLNNELEKARQVNRCAEVEEMESKLQEKERINQLLEERIELLKTRIVSGDNNSVVDESFKNKSRRRRTWGGPSMPTTFRRSFALPTINESDTKESTDRLSKKDRIKKRQSIIQTPVDDIVNEKFQTEIADFELELIESERNWETGRFSMDSAEDLEDVYVSKRRPGNHVQFMDDVSVYRVSYGESNTSTPEEPDLSSPPRSNNEKSPGTPKQVLRERMTHLADELNELRAFTTLEKQLYHEEGGRSKNLDSMEETMNHMRKSVADSEMMCLEVNKKFAELQDQHSELGVKYDAAVGECHMLRQQVESLHDMEERLKLIELERNEMKNIMDEKLQRLKVLEDERNDFEFRKELLESKHRARERELENSLQLAWKDHSDTSDKEKFFNAVHLRSVVDKLTKEIETLKVNSETSIPQNHPLSIENRNMKLKLKEFDTTLKSMEEEKTSLLKQIEELTNTLEERPTCDQLAALRTKINKVSLCKTEIEISNEVLETKLSKALATIENLPSANDMKEKNREISCLNAKVEEHASEISALKTSLEEISIEKISLETELSELHTKFNEIQAELVKQNNQVEVLTKGNSNLELGLTRLQTQLFDKEGKIIELTEQLEELRKLKEETQEISTPPLQSDLQPDIDQLKIDLIEKGASISELTEQLEQLTGRPEENNDMKSGFEIMQNKCEQQETEISNLKDHFAEVSKTKLEATHEYNMTRQKLEQIFSEKNLILHENAELKSKFSETTVQLKNNENFIDSLKADIDQLKSKLEEKSAELSDMKVKFTELQHISAQVESTSKQPPTEYIQRIPALEDELENSKKELNSRLEEIGRQKSEIASLVDTVSAKSNEIVTLTKTIEEMNITIEHSEAKFKSLAKELESNTILDSTYRINCENTLTKVTIPEICNPYKESPVKPKNLTGSEVTGNGDTSLKADAMKSESILDNDHYGVENRLEVHLSESIQEMKSPKGILVAANSEGKAEVNDGSEMETLNVTKDRVLDRIVLNGSSQTIDDALRLKLRELIPQNEALHSENTALKTKIEFLNEEMVLLRDTLESITIMETKLAELDSMKNSLETDLTQRDRKICELQDEIHKLQDLIVCMQSEKTLHEGTKCAMQKTIKEKEDAMQRIPKLEAQVRDLNLVRTEFEHMNVELRKQLNEKILELDSKGTHKYESEVLNLKSYVADLELFNKNIQSENGELKTRLLNQSTDLENDLTHLKHRIDEQEKVTHALEEDKTNLLQHLEELEATKTVVDITTTSSTNPIPTSKSLSEIVPKSSENKSHNESGSIFANASYFDDMDVSYGQNDSVFEQSNQNIANSSLYEDVKKSNDLQTLKKRIEELEESNKRLSIINEEFLTKVANAKDSDLSNEFTEKIAELLSTKTLLEDENANLAMELQLKIQESDEIKNDVHGLKELIAELHKTMHSLTSENMDMASKLNSEKERAKEAEINFQTQVDDLYARISKITEEKVTLKSELTIYQEQLEAMRANTPIATEDEVRSKIEEYQGKINSLTAENIELSSNLMDKIEELDKVKESKALLYDHECNNKKRVEELLAKIMELNNENIELSNNLMEKIEESDSLKNSCELLENKLDVSMKTRVYEASKTTENDISHLEVEISQLKAENVELKAKITTLSNENAKFSHNLLETMEELDNTRQCHNQDDKSFDKTALHLSMIYDKSVHGPSNIFPSEEGVETLTSRVRMLEEQIDQLTRLNKKLSDLKLSSCPQCTHLKELNDSRRTLKLEVKSLNNKLQDLQRKFERKCADTQILRNKASEDLNLSTLSDLTLNESMMEGLNITFVEEGVQSLNTEVEALKQSHDKLYTLYGEKCNELKKLQASSNCEVSSSQIELNSSDVIKKAKIERVQMDIDKLREEVQCIKKPYTILSESIQKFLNGKSIMQNEIDSLKSANEDLNTKLIHFENIAETSQEKVRILESELTNLNKEIEKLISLEKEAKNEKLNFEVEIDRLRADKESNQKALDQLKATLNLEKENKSVAFAELEELRKEREELIKQQNEQDLIYTSRLEESKKLAKEANEAIKESQDKLRETDTKLIKYATENSSLQEEIQKLQMIKETGDIDIMAEGNKEDMKTSIRKLSEENDSLNHKLETIMQSKDNDAQARVFSDYEKLKEEFDNARKYIIKEIKSLNPQFKSSDPSDKSVTELIGEFLDIVMMKEQEIIKTVQDRFEQDKQKLEDEKRQSVDAEKRVTIWAKELETEIEKLQGDMSNQEGKYKKLINGIERLEHDLKESNHEKQMLKEKLEVLETDFNSLQTELEMQSKVDIKQGEAASAAQEREIRLALEAAQNREAELQTGIKAEKEEYNRKIEDLTSALESYKTKNKELKYNIDGFEANERQLKSIIDLKSNDLAKSHQKIDALKLQNEQLEESCNNLNHVLQDKTQRTEEITVLLKAKCDKLSEFKTKLETITPEYEILKEQLKERKQSVDRYKSELDMTREESQQQLNSIRDKHNEELMKSGVLTKQLNELNNRNTELLTQLEGMRDKCEDLERNNDKLIQKMRNSTSKSRAEAEIEAYKDQISVLHKNAEGASNRITELQDSKGQVMRDLVELRGKYEMLRQEKINLEMIIAANKTKSNSPDIIELRGKYEVLLREKNEIALELEDKKILLVQKEKACTNYRAEIEQLNAKNKELDEEMEDMVKDFNILNKENAELTYKVSLFGVDSKSNDSLELKVSSLTKENEQMKALFTTPGTISLNYQGEVLKLRQQNKEQRAKLEEMVKMTDILRKENDDLAAKLSLDSDARMETRSCSSSRSASPLFETTRRKQRRSERFNQNRHLENASDAGVIDEESRDCRCTVLAQKVRELELELVSRNGKIATLEIQIQSENFPYQKKCKDLEENLLAFKSKNSELKYEVKRLQRAMTETSMRECEVCRKWRTNKRDQSTQSMPECKTYLSGMSSGIVEEHLKIQKLEKDKALMKDLCRSRMREIRDLQKRVIELEASKEMDVSVPVKTTDVNRTASDESIKSTSNRDKSQRSRRPMKENLPANILDNSPDMSSIRDWNIWSNYS